MVISATGSEIIERLELGSVYSSLKTNPAIQFKQKKKGKREGTLRQHPICMLGIEVLEMATGQ